MNIQEVRQQYPQYSDLSDEQLARALHAKYYADMPYEAFAAKVGTAPQQPTVEDPGFGQSALIGTGRTLDRLYEGLKESGLTVGAAFGSERAKRALEEQAQREQQNTEQYAKLQAIRPGATALGEAAPLVMAPMLGAGIGGIAASAALPGLMEYGTAEERLGRGAMGAAGGAIGAAAGRAISSVIKPTQSMTEAQRKALEAADRLGVKMTSGEASGNRALRWFEAASADMPIAAGVASRRMAGNDKAIAAGALRAVGQHGDEVTEGALAAARSELNQTFGNLLGGVQIQFDKGLQSELNAVTGSKVLKSLRDDSVDNLITEIRDVVKRGAADGEWFQQNKTALDAAIRSAYNVEGQAAKARALESVERALERAAMRSLPKDRAEAYGLAGKRWANLRLLETGKVVEDGRALPGRLKSVMETRYRGAFKEGKIQGELADIARLAGVLRQPPQSGTTPRAIYSGLVGGAAFAEPTTAAMMVAAPTFLQGITASPAMRNYMTKGLMNLSPEEIARLTRGGGYAGLLGAYGANQ